MMIKVLKKRKKMRNLMKLKKRKLNLYWIILKILQVIRAKKYNLIKKKLNKLKIFKKKMNSQKIKSNKEYKIFKVN